MRQQEVVHSWAMEARACAEDPARGFLPAPGLVLPPRSRVMHTHESTARSDTGSLITIYYDSLLAKVAAWGSDRGEAQRRLVRSLNGYRIEGLTSPTWISPAQSSITRISCGELTTDFIDEHFVDGVSKAPPASEDLHYMVIAAVLVYHSRWALTRESLKPMMSQVGGTEGAAAKARVHRRAHPDHFTVELDGDPESHRWSVRVDERTYEVVTPEFEFYRRRLNLKIDGVVRMFRLQYEGSHIRAFFSGIARLFEVYKPHEWELTRHMLRERKEARDDSPKCAMPGMITAVCVREGDHVQRGQELVRMESMKMETGIASPRDGKVEKILVAPGAIVETDDILISFAPDVRPR